MLIDDRYKCDTFTDHEYGGPTRIEVAYNEPNKTQVSNQTKYVRPPSVDSTSAMIGRNKTTKYDIYERYNRPNINYSFVGYYSGSANQFNVVSYRGFNKTTANYVDFWNEEAKAEMKLEFSKLYYVQRYTGELSVSNSSGYDEGGRFVYTDFYQNTGNYQYELKAVNVGPNFPFTNSNILSIDPFICSYEVTNLIFPPKGDINYNKYGNVGFEFRQISLTDPFPIGQGKLERS